MIRVAVCLVVGLVLSRTPALLAQGGKLEKIREVASRERPPSSDSGDSKPDRSRDYSDESDDGLLELIGLAVLSPFVVPAWCLGDTSLELGYFPRYPYADGQPGSLQIHFSEEEDPYNRGENPKYLLGRVALEGSTDFRGLDRLNGHLLLDSCFRLGLQTSWSYLTESLERDRQDNMVIGDINLVFRFAQSECVQMRSGLGLRLSADAVDSHAGFNFTYGMDVCPAEPLVFSAQLDLGSLGSAGVFHGRISAGVLLQRWEFYTGFDYLRVGSVDVYGPVAGLRCWF